MFPQPIIAGLNAPAGTIRAAALEAVSRRLTEVVAASAAGRRFERAVLIDLAGRTPLPDEMRAAAGQTRATRVDSLVRSLPFWEHFYEEELFYFLLVDNFRPSTDAFAALPALLQSGRTDVREALRQIVSSQFFNARNPGNDTFVTVVLEQILGKTVQKEVATLEAGKRMYDGYASVLLGKKGSSQADLVRIAVEDEAFEPCLLERRFTAIFGEPPPRKRLASDAARLRADPLAFPDLIAAWLKSEAYEERLAEPRPKSDRVFVRSLYVDLLRRSPDYQEFRRSRNALLALSDSRPLRSVLIKLMLDAGMGDVGDPGSDRAAFVRDLYLRFLAREPSAEELAALVRELEGGAAPRLIVRALLTHAEYQSY